MNRRVAHLLVLLVLPVWAQNPVPNSAPMVTPEAEAGPNLFMPKAQPRCSLSSYRQCIEEYYELFCSGVPPEGQQTCGDSVIADCRCLCFNDCP